MTRNHLISLNLLSLAFSVATLFFLYFFMRRLGVSAIASITAVLMYSFTPIFWKFAPRAEIYNVNAFFLAVTFFLFYLWDKKSNARHLFVSGLTYGVGLGVYFANILFFLPIVIFIIYECKKKNKDWVRPLALTWLAIFIGAAGPLVYIYFRSKILPPTGTFYNPDTILNLFLFLSGAQCGILSFGGWDFLIRRILSYTWLFTFSFIGIGLFFAFKGITSGWREKRGYTIFLLLSLITNFGYFTYYNAFDSYTMLGCSYLITTIFIGLGLDKILSGLIRLKKILLWSLAPLILLQVFFVPFLYRISYNQNLLWRVSGILEKRAEDLNSLPPNAVLFSFWYQFPSFLCMQTILKQRPDILFFESNDQPRNYLIGDKIETFTWHEYIDRHILNTNRPIYCIDIDDYLKERYRITKIKDGLFLVSPN